MPISKSRHIELDVAALKCSLMISIGSLPGARGVIRNGGMSGGCVLEWSGGMRQDRGMTPETFVRFNCNSLGRQALKNSAHRIGVLWDVARRATLLALVAGGYCLLCQSVAAADGARPNIVLVMCDDMGFSDIGCYGGEVRTPNLDRLAAEGMRFTQFYNNAKCTTTRASLLTGLYPRFGKPGHLRETMVTLGEAMQRAGYHTSLSGKWHLMKQGKSGKESVAGSWIDRFDPVTHPFHRGFDTFYGLLDGCSNFFSPVQRDPDYKGGRVRDFGRDGDAVTEFPKGYYTTDAFTDHAIESIRRFSGGDKPFFVHVTYTAPHYPLHAKPEDIAKYVGRFRMGWEQMRRDRWDRQRAMGLSTEAWRLTGTDSEAYSWDSADQEFEDLRMAVYAAMIDSMDQNIGRLMEALRASGQADNTLVMFFSDNGGCSEEPGGRDSAKRTPGPGNDYAAVGPAWGWAQNAPFRRYKSWLHEGGVTTPLIAWWPGRVPAGTLNRAPAHIIDLMPTFLEVAGSDYPREYRGHTILPCEGLSMTPLLEGKVREPHKQLAWFWAGNRAIREGDWKLVWDKLVGKWELYDLAVDRCETEDLAGRHPERVARLRSDYFDWAERVELKLPVEKP